MHKISFFILIILLYNPSLSLIGNTYDHIDKYVLNTPKSAEKNLAKLVQHLTKPCNNQKEKARAIFCWIAHNINYNVNAFLKKEYVDSSPEAVLKKKSSVCDGYANLFQQLAHEAGLESVKITGFAKDYNYELGSIFKGSGNHAWNAVKIDSHWYLLDVTWGAGYMNEDNKYQQYFNEYYFFTPPDEFIYNHFPDKMEWQLLENPISKQEFEQLTCLKPAFFNYDLKIISHKEWTIKTDNTIIIELSASENISIVAVLMKNKQELNDSFIFIQRSKHKILIHVLFPERGKYILRIFAKGKNEPGKYQWASDYQIETSKKIRGEKGFPQKYAKFEEADAYLFMPLDRYLKSGEDISFSIQVPGAEEVVLISDKIFIPLFKKKNLFSRKIKIKKGEIVIAAKFPGNNRYNGLLQYTGY
jgi:transglutaminase/protease-like cytokinesis protein 3